VPPFRGGQLRAPADPVLDARQDFDGADDCGRDERGRDDRRDDDAQPDRRTPSRTRMALNPSLHVIFFPSAYVRP
jgi:hypothetical protein